MIDPSVSRETKDKLHAYVDLIIKWNPKINLVSKNTLQNVWSRHIQDSIQVYDVRSSDAETWLDLGSGGGLPGVVISILAYGQPQHMVMIESDARKSAFLRQVKRELDLSYQVVTDRIEHTPEIKASIISARALANLDTLLGFVERHGTKDCQAIFPKGRTWETELQTARQKWHFDCEVITSKTDSEARILSITGVERV